MSVRDYTTTYYGAGYEGGFQIHALGSKRPKGGKHWIQFLAFVSG